MGNDIKPEDHLRLIKIAVNQLNLPKRGEGDYYQIGYIGLDRAIQTYDKQKGTFATWAVICIKSEMLRNPTILDVIPRESKAAWRGINLSREVERIQQQRRNGDLEPLQDVDMAELLGWNLDEFRRYMSYTSMTLLFDTSYIVGLSYKWSRPQSFLGDSWYYRNRIADELVVEPNYESLIMEGEIQAILERVEKSSGDDVTAFLLHDIYGYTYKEVSKKLKCALSTAEWKATRGRKIVRSELYSYYVEVMGHKPIEDIINEILEWADTNKDVKAFIIESSRKSKELSSMALVGADLVKQKYGHIYRSIVTTIRNNKKRKSILGV